MRCPNCNSRIENEADICRYCNYDITGKKNPTREEQIDYSKKYSNAQDDLTVAHDGQYEYSTRYAKYDGLDSSKEQYRTLELVTEK